MSNVITLEESVISNIKDKHNDMSNYKTPQAYIERRADGFDYVDEAYMRKKLNESFPIWSWEILDYQILGDVEVIVHGRLKIVDEGILRTFDSIASHRIQKSKSTGGYVNISNDIKSANTDAFKVALNRLCNIADDVYRKQVKDFDLSEEQVKNLQKIMKKLDAKKAEEVQSLIDNESINGTNYDKVVNKLSKQVK
tara:strand:+ start:512 stop:1099 length:588 start_codon:yes stop_codon:yes gene_type:complete